MATNPWRKSSRSNNAGECVEWRKSSRSANAGNCVEWRKSSRSNNAGQCVEWRKLDGFQVRDSKLGDASPILDVDHAEFGSLVAALKSGRLA